MEQYYIHKFDTDKLKKSKSFKIFSWISFGAKVFVKLIALSPFIILSLICCCLWYLSAFLDFLAEKLNLLHDSEVKLDEYLWDDYKILYVLLNIFGNKKYFKNITDDNH